MKQFKTYITEKILINKNTEINMFDGIDIYKWEWPEHGMSDDMLKQCKDHIYNFADKHFKNDKSPISELFKETFRFFLQTQYNNQQKINKMYDEMMHHLKNNMWSHFEYSCIPQGWWHFTNWLIEQYNKNN